MVVDIEIYAKSLPFMQHPRIVGSWVLCCRQVLVFVEDCD